MKLRTKIFLGLLPSKIKTFLINKGKEQALFALKSDTSYLNNSYSQEGEDLILARYFSDKESGFYVDIGAYHPQKFSNTYLFYKRGWHGINVDAMPGSMEEFKKVRAKDINLEMPISNNSEFLTYYIFNEPALNTFDSEMALQKNGYKSFRLLGTRSLKCRTLKSLFDEYIPDGRKIDFLSIDVEGLDLNVLKSNDWAKYRPEVIIIEDLFRSVEEILNRPIYQFLADSNYRLMSKTINSLFFVDKR